MAHLIDKDALLAEIERRKQDAINNCGGFKSIREHECDSCIVGQYEEMEEILNTLEVKEVQKEPVSEDLEEEIIRYIGFPQEVDEDVSTTMIRKAAHHFANWQKEQFEKEKEANEDNQDTTRPRHKC